MARTPHEGIRVSFLSNYVVTSLFVPNYVVTNLFVRQDGFNTRHFRGREGRFLRRLAEKVLQFFDLHRWQGRVLGVDFHPLIQKNEAA